MLHAGLALVALWLPLRAAPPAKAERLVALELVRLPPPVVAKGPDASLGLAPPAAPPRLASRPGARARSREAIVAAGLGSSGLLALLGASTAAPLDGAFLSGPLVGAGASDALVGVGHATSSGTGGGATAELGGLGGGGELRGRGTGEGRIGTLSGAADPAPAEILRRLRARAAACYPRSLARLRTEGTVVVKFCVDEAGAVTGPSVLSPSGAGALDDAALSCVVGGVGPLPVPREGGRCLRVPIRFRAAP